MEIVIIQVSNSKEENKIINLITLNNCSKENLIKHVIFEINRKQYK